MGISLFFNKTLTEKQPNKVLTTAEIYFSMGWSVIPTSGKVATVPWLPFQTRPPSIEQLSQWFEEDDYTGLAIITGSVSQLAVLDFDDPILKKIFAKRYPHLAETYTIQTKRGFHLYYHMPPHLRLASRRVPGVDLQYNGKYVVAPPSIIAGHTYKSIRGGFPKTLAEKDIGNINRFLDRRQKAKAESIFTALHSVDVPEVKISTPKRLSELKKPYSDAQLLPSDLAAIYRDRVSNNGRNDTLFKLSCLGRDNSLTQDQVTEALADLHAEQQLPGNHWYEPIAKRYREAIRTIGSAYSRPPRESLHQYKEPDQLPNPVREELFARKMTYAVRTIEALRWAGVQQGDAFTKKQAVGWCKGVVGQGSVYNAINTILENGQALFERLENPLPRTPSPNGYAVAKKKCLQAFSKCLENTLLKPLKSNLAHRPPEYFIMPGNTELAERLEVRRSNISDELTIEDIKSAKTTRTAHHSGLIRRKPGQYTINFFAKRVGMSERTVYRYNAEDEDIHGEPIYRTTQVFWTTLEAVIPPDPTYFPHAGVFLEDTKGKKYPPKREIARKLLVEKQQVILKQRLPNYWWYGDAQKAMPVRLQADYYAILEQMNEKAKWRQRSFIPRYEYPVVATKSMENIFSVPCQDTRTESPATRNMSKPIPIQRPARHGQKTKYRQPLSNSEGEAFAQYALQVIIDMSQGKEDQITIASVRRLVDRYGEKAVQRAINSTAKRQNVRKPIGFISTLLRSEKVAQQLRGLG
jgi:hypothetical protein